MKTIGILPDKNKDQPYSENEVMKSLLLEKQKEKYFYFQIKN